MGLLGFLPLGVKTQSRFQNILKSSINLYCYIPLFLWLPDTLFLLAWHVIKVTVFNSYSSSLCEKNLHKIKVKPTPNVKPTDMSINLFFELLTGTVQFINLWLSINSNMERTQSYHFYRYNTKFCCSLLILVRLLKNHLKKQSSVFYIGTPSEWSIISTLVTVGNNSIAG